MDQGPVYWGENRNLINTQGRQAQMGEADPGVLSSGKRQAIHQWLQDTDLTVCLQSHRVPAWKYCPPSAYTSCPGFTPSSTGTWSWLSPGPFRVRLVLSFSPESEVHFLSSSAIPAPIFFPVLPKLLWSCCHLCSCSPGALFLSPSSNSCPVFHWFSKMRLGAVWREQNWTLMVSLPS